MEKEQQKPVIGISGRASNSEYVTRAIEQIEQEGGIPLFLGNHIERDAADDIHKIDALMLMGNPFDINPADYNATEIHDATDNEQENPTAKARANYEKSLITRAVSDKMPLYGICGGMQRINVVLGGSLHQHIPDELNHDNHMQVDCADGNAATDFPFSAVHSITICPQTTLNAIVEKHDRKWVPGSNINVNSVHHQAVDRLGSGLISSAYTDEKIEGNPLIEAIEADPEGDYGRQFILGVQWHPEFEASALGRAIAQKFVSEAANYAREHSRSHDSDMITQENRISMVEPASTSAQSNAPSSQIT